MSSKAGAKTLPLINKHIYFKRSLKSHGLLLQIIELLFTQHKTDNTIIHTANKISEYMRQVSKRTRLWLSRHET